MIFMDSWEFNKIAGAILGTALMVFGLTELRTAIYHAPLPAKPGFAIQVTAPPSEAETGGGQAAKVPLGTLLAKADPAKGQAIAKACQACHDFTKGGPNKVGPNLWDVVDRPIASHPGFAYSDSLKQHSGDKWTFENLNTFVHDPKSFAPNTKMTFSGIKPDTQRADVLAFLRTLSDNPKPLPAP
jgi:cytochrome c